MRVNKENFTPPVNVRKSVLLNSVSRSTHRYTPYRKTPKSRQISLTTTGLSNRTRPRLKRTPTQSAQQRRKDDRSNIILDQEPQDLKGLTFKTWKLYKLSPLYKFSSNPKDLKKVGSFLSAHMEAERQKGTYVDVSDDTLVGKALISHYKGVKVSPDDPEAIQILIKGKGKSIDETVLLTALLCAVDMEENPLRKSMQDKFVYYPIMLVKGSVTMTNTLVNLLEMMYDCKITPLTFSSYDLAWMVAMWSGSDISQVKSAKPVELLYSVPEECKGLSKITYTIDPQDCHDLWDSIHDSDNSEFTTEEVRLFMKSLEEHFYQVFKVKLSALQLIRVGTPLCFVGHEGRLKLFLSKNVQVVLRHLTELATERTFSYNLSPTV